MASWNNIVKSNASPVSEENYIGHDDSGNFSCSSIASEDALPRQQAQRYSQPPLKEQPLYMQDLRKLHSELERLSKSEQWYKRELKSQKSTRLETLERLYTQERKYMYDNQRLQEECLRLYTKCTEFEKAAELQRERNSNSDSDNSSSTQLDATDIINEESENVFEIKQQQSLISDQCQLIDVLRKQKKQLLADIQRLSHEHDEKLLNMQQALASMDLENKRVTGKCKQLLDEKNGLELRLQDGMNNLHRLTIEREKLRQVINNLNENHLAQEKLLVLKEQQFSDLKRQYNTQLQDETNTDEVHRLSLAYHTEINTKTTEIAALKMSLQKLQFELENMAELETKNEQQMREIEQLSFALETQRFEYENLIATNSEKSKQIDELSLCLERTRTEQVTALKSLREAQQKSKKFENELISLHKQYASMCALCESTKFELELQEIEAGKLKCQTACDEREIMHLRESLKQYLHKTAELSQRIGLCESQLEHKSNELPQWRQRWQKKADAVEKLQRQVDQLQTACNVKSALDSDMCQMKVAEPLESNYKTITNKNENSYKILCVDSELQSSPKLKDAECGDCKSNQIELLNLQKKIFEMEQKLKSIEEEKRRTLTLLQQLLQQRENKSNQLYAFHTDWDDLLEAMKAMQEFEEQMRGQLHLKTVELEELNTLFAAQNEELHQLQKLAYLSECKRDEEFQQLKVTFQQQLQTLSDDNKDKTEKYEQLREESEKLQSVVKSQIDNLLEDRDVNAKKMQALETELVELRRNDGSVSQATGDEWLRALTKLMESECGRKLKYDLPMVVRSVKRLIKTAKVAKSIKRTDDVQLLKRHLEDLRLKYELSQQRNKLLEQTLLAERKKFEASDFGKSSTQHEHHNEPAHEVANLIDDYKKLTLQSADATGRPRTSAILDLIDRSNRCKPNLIQLSNSVADFRDHMQQLSDILTNVELNYCRKDTCSSDGLPSLMEELRAVAEKL